MSELRLESSAARRLRAVVSTAMPRRLTSLILPVAGALVLWFSAPTIASLYSIWLTDADYTHGPVLFLLSAALVIRELRDHPIAQPDPSAAGAGCVLLLMAALLSGRAATADVVAQAALPALWIAAIWAFAGAGNARRLATPLAYLYLAIPVWNVLIEPMRSLTIFVVSAWTRAVGIPAFIEGNLVHVPSGTFEVEGGCAGLRYLLVAVTLAVFRALLLRRPLAYGASLTLLAVTLALVGNWLRVFVTVAAGLSPRGWLPLMVHNHHTFFGWVMFLVFMVPLFYVDGLLPGSKQTRRAEPVAQPSVRAASASTVTSVTLVALVVGVWLGQRIDGGSVVAGAASMSVPEVGGWQRTLDWQGPSLPVFVGHSAEAAAWYENGAARVGAYAAQYASQSQEHEVVFAHNRPEGSYGTVVARGVAAATTPAGVTVPFRELEVRDSSESRRLVWVGLRVAGTTTAGNLMAKVLQVGGAVRGRRDAQALVLTAHCDADCGDARSWLAQFAAVAAQPFYERAERAVASPAESPAGDPRAVGTQWRGRQ